MAKKQTKETYSRLADGTVVRIQRSASGNLEASIVDEDELKRVGAAGADPALAAGPEPDMMNVRETAQYLRLGERTVYNLANRGEIPAARLAGKWRFSKAGLSEWLEKSQLKNLKNEEDEERQ